MKSDETRVDRLLQSLRDAQRDDLTDHPEPTELNEFIRQQLGSDAERRVAEHLSQCRPCTQQMLTLIRAATAAQEEAARTAEPKMPWFADLSASLSQWAARLGTAMWTPGGAGALAVRGAPDSQVLVGPMAGSDLAQVGEALVDTREDEIGRVWSLCLEPADSQADLRVICRYNDRPDSRVRGRSVQLYQGERAVAAAVLDGSGEARFPGVAPGMYSLLTPGDAWLRCSVLAAPAGASRTVASLESVASGAVDKGLELAAQALAHDGERGELAITAALLLSAAEPLTATAAVESLKSLPEVRGAAARLPRPARSADPIQDQLVQILQSFIGSKRERPPYDALWLLSLVYNQNCDWDQAAALAETYLQGKRRETAHAHLVYATVAAGRRDWQAAAEHLQNGRRRRGPLDVELLTLEAHIELLGRLDQGGLLTPAGRRRRQRETQKEVLVAAVRQIVREEISGEMARLRVDLATGMEAVRLETAAVGEAVMGLSAQMQEVGEHQLLLLIQSEQLQETWETWARQQATDAESFRREVAAALREGTEQLLREIARTRAEGEGEGDGPWNDLAERFRTNVMAGPANFAVRAYQQALEARLNTIWKLLSIRSREDLALASALSEMLEENRIADWTAPMVPLARSTEWEATEWLRRQLRKLSGERLRDLGREVSGWESVAYFVQDLLDRHPRADRKTLGMADLGRIAGRLVRVPADPAAAPVWSELHALMAADAPGWLEAVTSQGWGRLRILRNGMTHHAGVSVREATEVWTLVLGQRKPLLSRPDAILPTLLRS